MKKEKVLAIIAIGFALIWAVFIIRHFLWQYIWNEIVFNTPGQAWFRYLVHDPWSSFIRFTFQTSIATIIWLLLFGITRLTGRANSRLSGFVTNQILMVSLVVYMTILFIYGIGLIAVGGYPNFPGEGYFHMLDGHSPFTYFIAPILIWTIFLFTRSTQTTNNIGSLIKPLIVLIYPIIYFIMSMIIGYTVNWSDYPYHDADGNYVMVAGGRAFSYPFLNPEWYPNFALFVITMLGIVVVIYLLAFFLFKIKPQPASTNDPKVSE